MPQQPLAEVFGFPIQNSDAEATRHRKSRLCPFNNKVANCTKDKANDPLGVCSVFGDNNEPIITCPIRFREGWIIAEDAADFFFSPDTNWTTLTEVRLKDKYAKSAGNIDVVLVAYDGHGKVTDFGALEVQAVYISGNVRNPFAYFMADSQNRKNMDWTEQPNYPHADYLSSSRKRLAPQLIFKGGILKAWRKKTAVALNKGFFATLPTLKEVSKRDAEVAWLVYDLVFDARIQAFKLTRIKTVYTAFNETLEKITRSEPGDMADFVGVLQEKVTAKLENPPDTETIDAHF